MCTASFDQWFCHHRVLLLELIYSKFCYVRFLLCHPSWSNWIGTRINTKLVAPTFFQIRKWKVRQFHFFGVLTYIMLVFNNLTEGTLGLKQFEVNSHFQRAHTLSIFKVSFFTGKWLRNKKLIFLVPY